MSLPAAETEMTRAIKHRQKFEGHTNWIEGVIHLPGGQRIMTCAWDDSLRVWNLENGKQIGNDWRDGQSEVYSIASSTGKVITKWTAHEDWIPSVCWNGDGRQVLSGCLDGTDETMIATGGGIRKYEGEEKERRKEEEYIKIWDSKTGKLVTKLKGHRGRVRCLAWTGSTLISGSSDLSIRTWNTITWQQINVWTGHTDHVYDIAISPNDRILASASIGDNTARLWNLENGQPIASPLQHAESVRRVSFSTDGKLLATGCSDDNAYTWDVSVIVTEAGLAELLLDPSDDKKLLDANATRCPRQRRENIDANRLPPSFFKDSSPHPRPSRRRPSSPSSIRQHHIAGHLSSHERTLLGRISPLFRRNHYDTTPPPHFLAWSRNPFFNTPRTQNDDGIVLKESHPAVVDVPSAQGRPRNYSAREVRMKKEKEKARDAKNAKIAQNASAGSSGPPQSSVTLERLRLRHLQTCLLLSLLHLPHLLLLQSPH